MRGTGRTRSVSVPRLNASPLPYPFVVGGIYLEHEQRTPAARFAVFLSDWQIIRAVRSLAGRITIWKIHATSCWEEKNGRGQPPPS